MTEQQTWEAIRFMIIGVVVFITAVLNIIYLNNLYLEYRKKRKGIK